jgi:hypothetical protein
MTLAVSGGRGGLVALSGPFRIVLSRMIETDAADAALGGDMDHPLHRRTRLAYALVAAPAALGAVLGAFAYFGADTGVDGTVGALLAIVGAVAVTGPRSSAWRPCRGGCGSRSTSSSSSARS